MATRTNTAEGGINSAVVTTANSGGTSGSAFNNFAGTSPTFTTDQHVAGAYSYAIQADSGSTSIIMWTGLSATDMGMRVSVRIASNPTLSTEIAEIRNATTPITRLYISSGGKVQINDATTNNTVFLATTSLSLNTWYDISMHVAKGTGTTDGTIALAYYLSSAPTSPIQSYSSTTVNTGTATLTEVRYGKVSASTWPDLFWIDNLYATDAAAGALPGPVVSAAIPTLVTNTGATYLVNATSSASANGGALSYSAALVSGATLTYSQPSPGIFSFTQPSGSSSVYSITISEAGGGSSTGNVTIPPAASTTGLAQTVVRINGVWT